VIALAKRMIPEGIKTAIKSRIRNARLRLLFRELSTRRTHEGLTKSDLERFRVAHGNTGYSADSEYLLEIARQATKADGPILECGSGVSTLVIGMIASRSGIRVISLEQDERWGDAVTRDLQLLGISSVEVIRVPLVSYGSYDWYDIDAEQLPHHFYRVFCDGPTSCKGWRFGVVPVLGQLGIGFDALVCDDADDPASASTLMRWESEFGLSVERRVGMQGELAICRPATGTRCSIST